MYCPALARKQPVNSRNPKEKCCGGGNTSVTKGFTKTKINSVNEHTLAATPSAVSLISEPVSSFTGVSFLGASRLSKPKSGGGGHCELSYL